MRQRRKTLALLGAMACMLLIAGGCAGTRQGGTVAPDTKLLAGYQYARFMSDYSTLKPDADGKAMVYAKPGFDFKGYDKVMVDRLTFFYKGDADYKGIDPTELKALADYFHDVFVKDLGKDYPLVNETGPNVLRIRAAITEMVPNKPLVSVVTLVVPYLTAADLASGVASKGGTGSNFYVGETVIEAEILDSATNEQLVAYVERYIPKKYDVELDKGVVGAVTKGVGQYVKAYSTWEYTRDAFDYWALKLRHRLDEAHGKKPSE
jgi:hypothetical protein